MTLLVEGTHLDPRKELPKPSYELLPEAVVDTFTGLGIDIKPFRNFDPELISATTDYAVTVLSEATKRFYALETPVASSDISERYAVCVSEAVDTVDIAPVLEVIETHASTPALTEKYENNFNTIYDSFLIAAKSAVVPAIINLDTAYSVGDVEQLKTYEKTFKPLGFTVEPYIEKVGEPLPPNERIVPKQAVVKTAAILAGGALLMTMNVGPAAAADNGNGNQGHGNGNNNPAVVQVLQADGTVSQETPVVAPSQTSSESQPSPETTPDSAMQPNQDTSQSQASDQQPSVASNDANTNSVPEATPTVDPGVSAPKAITGKVVTSIDPITGKEVTPNIPAAQTDPNPQDAQLAVDGLTPSIKDGLVKLSDAVQQGNAAPLISSSSDGLAIKPDPTHPDKTKPTVFDADLQAKLGVDLAITKGILLGDAETIAVINTYFASHPTKLDPNLQQALDEVQKLDFTTGKGDLTAGQKAAYIQLSLLMSGEMTATAEAQQAAATDAYNAAQAKAAAEQAAADARAAEQSHNQRPTDKYSILMPKIIDENQAAKAINDYIQSVAPDSPFVGLGADFIKGAKKHGVNPFLAVVIAQMDSNIGTAGVAAHYHTNNPWNRDCPAGKPRVHYTDGRSNHNHSACTYDSPQQALLQDDYSGAEAAKKGHDSIFAYINRRYISRGTTNLEDFLAIYTPASESSNAEHQQLLAGYKREFDKIYAMAGDSIAFKVRLSTLKDLPSNPGSRYTTREVASAAQPGESMFGPNDPCSKLTGNVRILCAAEKFFGVRYGTKDPAYAPKWEAVWGQTINSWGGHNPKGWILRNKKGSTNDFLECSGFVAVAIAGAFNVDVDNCSAGFLSDKKNFMQIDPHDVRPGDLVIASKQCGGKQGGHVGLVKSYNKDTGKLVTYESSAGWSSRGDARSGEISRHRIGVEFHYAVRYIGPGSDASLTN